MTSIELLAVLAETALLMLEPAYRTYKVLKSTRNSNGVGGDPAEARRLLVHWVVYAAFRSLDFVVRPWLPFYEMIKLGSVVYLHSGGTETAYQKLEPFIADFEPTGDRWLASFAEFRTTVVGTVTASISEAAAESDRRS